jgi:hypothetical protein
MMDSLIHATAYPGMCVCGYSSSVNSLYLKVRNLWLPFVHLQKTAAIPLTHASSSEDCARYAESVVSFLDV